MNWIREEIRAFWRYGALGRFMLALGVLTLLVVGWIISIAYRGITQ